MDEIRHEDVTGSPFLSRLTAGTEKSLADFDNADVLHLFSVHSEIQDMILLVSSSETIQYRENGGETLCLPLPVCG